MEPKYKHGDIALAKDPYDGKMERVKIKGIARKPNNKYQYTVRFLDHVHNNRPKTIGTKEASFFERPVQGTHLFWEEELQEIPQVDARAKIKANLIEK